MLLEDWRSVCVFELKEGVYLREPKVLLKFPLESEGAKQTCLHKERLCRCVYRLSNKIF